jgi:hypothetical protein
MAQTTLHEILDQLRTLEPDELRHLERAVRSHLGPQAESPKRETFHQALLASGLVKQIRSPGQDRDVQRRLIEVQGRPVSETIIAERR